MISLNENAVKELGFDVALMLAVLIDAADENGQVNLTDEEIKERMDNYCKKYTNKFGN